MKTTMTFTLAAFGILGASVAWVSAQDSPRYAPYVTAQQVRTPSYPESLPPGPSTPTANTVSRGQGQGQGGQGQVMPQPVQTTPGAVAGTGAANMPAPCNSCPPAANAGNCGGGGPCPTSPNADGTTTPPEVYDNGLWPGAATLPGCSICGGGNCAPPDWYVEQEVRILSRSRPRDQVMGYDFNTSGTAEFETLNTRSAVPGISAAWGMTVGHYFARDTENRDHFVEFSFWGLNNWNDEATVNGHRMSYDSGTETTKYGSLNSAYTAVPHGYYLMGFNNADIYTVHYTSTTNNFELNGRFTPRGRPDREVFLPDGHIRRECQPGTYMSYLYGMRFFKLDETYRWHSESAIDVYDDTTGDLIRSNEYTGDYDIVTHNNLLGLQLGAELMFRQCRWAWGFTAKAGPYVNFCDAVSDINADESAVSHYYRRISASKHSAAFIGELGVEATYKFRPTLMGRIGYGCTWVTGVAVAPEQLQFAVEPSNKMNTNGLAFFQNLTLGLEWMW